MAKIIPASADDVRKFFAENPAKVPTGDKTVGKAPGAHRGRLSKDAQSIYAAETGRTYVVGTRTDLIDLEVTYKQPSGKTARKIESKTISEVRMLAGDAAAKRGRLTEAAMKRAAEVRGEQLTAESAERVKAKSAKPKAKAVKAPKAETVETATEEAAA